MRNARPGSGRQAQTGTTLVELAVVTALVGIVANVAVPVGLYILKRAQAQTIIEDFLAVQQAAIQYHNDRGGYPPEYSAGQEPTELRPYIKGRILWNNTHLAVQYDWEDWIKKNGQPKYPAFGILIGFTIQTNDASMLRMLQSIYPGPFVVTLSSDRLTLAIAK